MKLTTLVILISLFSSITMKSMITRSKRSNLSAYLSRFKFNFPNVNKHTVANNWGNGATIYLDRHNVNCDIGALTSFHYKRQGGTRFMYDYSCINPIGCSGGCAGKIRVLDKKKCKNMHTPFNILGKQYGKSTNFLDRHNLQCPVGMVMKGFKFQRKPPQVTYLYTCCPAKLKNCKTFKTKPTDYGDFSTIYLDRQMVSVSDRKTQAITGIHLTTDYKRHGYVYQISYCTING